jgi:hypothetical protein
MVVQMFTLGGQKPSFLDQINDMFEEIDQRNYDALLQSLFFDVHLAKKFIITFIKVIGNDWNLGIERCFC